MLLKADKCEATTRKGHRRKQVTTIRIKSIKLFFFGQESIKLKTVKLTRSNEYFVCTDP